MNILLFEDVPKNSANPPSPSPRPPNGFPRRMDRRLLIFLVSHLASGVVAALVSVGALIAFNIGGVRDLIVKSEIGWVAVLLLVLGFVVTFGSAAMGIAIMTRLSVRKDSD